MPSNHQDKDFKMPPHRMRFSRAIKYVLLAGLLAITLLLAWKRSIIAEKENQARYKELTDQIAKNITSSLHSYIIVLQGLAGTVISSENVTRSEWKAHCDYRDIKAKFPGVIGAGFSKVVRPGDLKKHIQEVRAEGFPDYTVWPAGNRELYTPIVYIEPFDEQNRRAFGYDMFSEPAQREAIELARDTGEIILSGGVTLVQEDSEKIQRSFAVYIPIYANGVRPQDLETRRSSIFAYVCGAGRIGDWIQKVSSDYSDKIAVQIYDGRDTSSDTLLYDSIAGEKETAQTYFSSEQTIEQYNHFWTLAFSTRPDLENTFDKNPKLGILVFGSFISLLSFFLLRAYEKTNDQALTIAQAITLTLQQREEKLRQTKRQSELILNAVGDGIYGLDTEGKAVFVNPVAARLLGYSQEEMLGQCMHSLVHHTRADGSPYPASECFSNISIRENRIMVVGDEVFWHKDRTSFPVECTSAPLLSDDKQPIGAVVIFRNISTRKQTEADLLEYRTSLEKTVQQRNFELKKSEGHLKSIIDNLLYALITISEDGIIRTFNPAAEKLFGYKASEIIGKNVKILAPEPHRSNHDEYLRRYCETGITHVIDHGQEVTAVRKDGSEFPIDLSVSEFRFENLRVFTGLTIDISDRKKVEQTLLAAKSAAEAANKAKSTFLANMSHEIRTPMNAILGFSQILERDHSLTPQQADHVGTIIRSGNHLLSLINDILDLSKIEAGKTIANLSTFSLHDFLDETEMIFRARALEKEIEFTMNRHADLPTHIVSDATKLRQIVVNLLGNAIKFTDTGKVAISARAEPVEVKASSGSALMRLIIEVEDTGPGISEQDLTQLFSSFQQAEAGIQAGGTGLGLVISRSFARLLGGDINVSSQVGKGSVFQVQIQIEAVEITEISDGQTKPEERHIIGLKPNSGPFKVLIVDDIQDNRKLLLSLLLPIGFEVQEAKNGAEALEIFETWAPHIILMDMQMPIMDGYEATRRLKATESGRATPIIAITASAFDEDEKKVFDAGVDAFLRKPFLPDELFTIMGKLLDLPYTFAVEPSDQSSKPKFVPIAAKHLAALPEELLLMMRQSVADGDMAHLHELIVQVKKIDNTTALGLKKLADHFEYEKLTQLLSHEVIKNA